MKTYSFIQNQGSPILFVKHSSLKKIIILIVYVDDIIVTDDGIKEIKSVKDLLAKEFVIKDLGNLRYFLGMEIARSKHGITISQGKNVLDFLKETEVIVVNLLILSLILIIN